jgi:orotidine-5'-phosphate decarboxylase
VTVLTSIDDGECLSIFGDEPGKKVLQFSQFILDEGAQGIICSTKEISLIRHERKFDELILATPGVRSTWAEQGDQSRVMTPHEAAAAGGDYFVIGQPISQPPQEIGSSANAVKLVTQEIAEGLAARAQRASA